MWNLQVLHVVSMHYCYYIIATYSERLSWLKLQSLELIVVLQNSIQCCPHFHIRILLP